MPDSSQCINPYPGLRPFEQRENRLFFGREGQSDELLERLARTRFVAVVGTSGTGKSSLVRAGLLPALFGDVTGIGYGWKVAVMRPRNDPITRLARALNRVAGAADGGTEVSAVYAELLGGTLRRSTLGLIRAAEQLRPPGETRAEKLLIVVDQFEELFRFKRQAKSRADRDEAAAFVNLLIESTRQEEVPVYVVLTMRSDYLGDCAQFRNLPEAINDGQYLIPRMTREQRRRAIIGPAGVAGGEIAPQLVNRLLNDLGEDPERLPLLQHVLMRTWAEWVRESSEGAVDIPHYEAVGEMKGALSNHADEIYEGLKNDRLRLVAERIFRCLVEIDAGRREDRRPTQFGTILRATGATHEEAAAVVEAFREQGRSFLTPAPPAPLLPETEIDISHESLIRGWMRLRGWAEAEAESARTYKRLAETARLYRKKSADLYRNPDLALALRWYAEESPNVNWARRYDPAYNSAIRFLKRSVMRHARRRRLYTLTIVGILLLAVAAMVFGIYARRQQRLALSRKLTTSAVLLRPKDTALSLLLAEEALKIEETDEAKMALRDALQAHSLLTTILVTTDSVRGAAFSPRGKLIVTAGGDGVAKVWSWAADGGEASAVEELRRDNGPVTSAVFDHSGSRVLTTGAGGLAFVWTLNPETGKQSSPAVELKGHGGIVNRGSFSHDDTYVVTASSDGTARVWRIGRDRADEVAVLGGDAGSVRSAAFDDSGKYIITASWDKPVRIWDWQSRQDRPVEVPQIGVESAVFSPELAGLPSDERRILTASRDGTARLWSWNPSNGRAPVPIKELPGHEGAVLSVSFSADGKRIVTAGSDNRTIVWESHPDASTPFSSQYEPINVLSGHADWVNTAAFSVTDGGKFVVTASDDGSARVWKSEKEKGPIMVDRAGASSGLEYLSYNPQNNQLVTVGRDKKARLYSMGSRADSNNGSGDDFVRFLNEVDASGGAAFADDVLVTIRSQQTPGPPGVQYQTGVRSWTADLKLADPPPKTSGGNSQQNMISVVTSMKGAALAPPRHEGGTSLGQKTPSYVLTTDTDNRVRIWDTERGVEVTEPIYVTRGGMPAPRSDRDEPPFSTYPTATPPLKPAPVVPNSASFSPDRKSFVVSYSDGFCRVWSWDWTATNLGEPRTLLRSENELGKVNTAAYSADGRLIIAAGDDGKAHIWNAQSGRLLLVLSGHSGSVNSAAFSSDGRHVVTAGEDGKLEVWEVAGQMGTDTGDVLIQTSPIVIIEQAEAGTSTGHPRGANFAIFGPGDEYVISANSDGLMRLYRWTYFRPLGQLRDEAIKKAGRRLTDDERKTYFIR